MLIEKELDGGQIENTPDQTLDPYDRRILDMIQSDFPIASRPYAVIGRQVGLSEEEAFSRVKTLKARKIIRRIGANFQSSRLGYKSTLCAARVPEEKLDLFVHEVNSHVGVTHNYLRNHKYNVWFTCIGPSWEEVCGLLEEITARTGVPILNLPAKRMYKIRVDFPLS